MLHCKDCGSTEMQETSYELICCNCGLIDYEGYAMLVDYTYDDYMEKPQTMHQQNEMFSCLQAPLNLNADTMNLAQEIFRECKVKGESRRKAFTAAAIYYAKPETTFPELSEVTGLTTRAINQAATEIFENTVKFRYLVESRNAYNDDINDHQIHRYLKNLVDLTYKQKYDVKNQVHKLQEKYGGRPELKPYKDDKVLVTMIYQAMLKIKIVPHPEFFKDMNISKATIKKISNELCV